MSKDFERFSSFDALYEASYKVCRNVRWKDSVTNFEENRINNILRMIEELQNGTYEQLPFSCFTVIERGKSRNIRACFIDDRMIQNSLCEQVLLPELTPKFVYDNCATLKDKGIDFALTRVKKHLQMAHREYGFGNDFFGARVDIKKYFDSINHQALKENIRNRVSDPEIQHILEYFVDTFDYKVTLDKQPINGKQYFVVRDRKYVEFSGKKFKPHYKYYENTPQSIGLGSQTSQLLALLTLNDVDHFIKEKLYIKYYGRYMDDLYLIHNDSKYLAYCLDEIEKQLSNIGLTMNHKKSYISRIHPLKDGEKKKEPFKYLKWDFYITDTNRIIQLPFKEKIAKQRRRLRKMAKSWEANLITDEDVQQAYSGWRAHIDKGNTFYILQDMDNLFKSLFKGVEIK